MAHMPERPTGEDAPTSARTKRSLLWVAGVRTVVSLVALPLAPFLYRHHFLVLVLLRPSQGVLLAGAVLARHGDVPLPAVVAAAVPLQVVMVWVYYGLGRAWQEEIESDDELPFVTARLLQPRQVRRLRRSLRDDGARLIVLGRFAIFPTGLLAATAGASDLEPRRFFVADGLALLAATTLVVGAGYGFGVAVHRGDVWLAVVGVAGLVTLSGSLTAIVWRGSRDR
jgi:membrane protein DedA with SNARE-associated domain